MKKRSLEVLENSLRENPAFLTPTRNQRGKQAHTGHRTRPDNSRSFFSFNLLYKKIHWYKIQKYNKL
uniref:Uncharacterized protein n=1 Tax=Anguilla anguilla TaxID=7936 RepID=A0A0E9Y019_ANGAN